LPYNPVPLNIYPGSIGENVPVGTIITITILSTYSVRLSEIGIINNNSNAKTISVEYLNTNNQIVLNSNNQTSTVNKPGSLILTGQDLPVTPVYQIIIKITGLIDNTKNATIVISVKGCFGKNY